MQKIIICFIFILFGTANLFAQKEVVYQPDSLKGIDAWIWSFDPAKSINFGSRNESNYGMHNVLRAEVWKWGGKEQPDTIRGLIKFDLSDIPQKASIIEARLSLYFYANPGFTPQLGDNELLIQRITEDWDEDDVNWLNQPLSTEHNQIKVEKSSKQEQDYLNIDIRNLVQEMVYFPEKNYGFLLRLEREKEFNGLTFASSDHNDSSKHPKLYIKYISQ